MKSLKLGTVTPTDKGFLWYTYLGRQHGFEETHKNAVLELIRRMPRPLSKEPTEWIELYSELVSRGPTLMYEWVYFPVDHANKPPETHTKGM